MTANIFFIKRILLLCEFTEENHVFGYAYCTYFYGQTKISKFLHFLFLIQNKKVSKCLGILPSIKETMYFFIKVNIYIPAIDQ